LVSCAAYLYRAVIGPSWTAGLAGLLYAVDDAHALPATYLANRNALIATCFGLACVLCHVSSRQRGWRLGAVLGPCALALGLCAGEMAVATLGYLAAFALILDRGTLWQRIKPLAGYAAVAAIWAAVYVRGHFGARGSGYYVDPLGDPVSFAWAMAQHVPLLLLGQWTPISAELAQARGMHLGALALMVALGFALVPMVRASRSARFWCLGMLLSLLPIAAAGPMNRLLFFVGVGSMGLLALLIEALVKATAAASSPIRRIAAGTIGLVLLTIHLVLAPPLALATIREDDAVSRSMLRAIASVPSDAEIARQDLVVINPADYIYTAMAIGPVQHLAGLPAPRRLRTLGASSNAMHIERLDPRTLSIRPTGGLFTDAMSRYYRARTLPFHPGDHVQLDGFSVLVRAVDRTGNPTQLLYRFAVPLEDHSLRWLQWRDGRYHAWSPPRVGSSVSLPAARGIFEVE
jgi:hypothetical protein